MIVVIEVAAIRGAGHVFELDGPIEVAERPGRGERDWAHLVVQSLGAAVHHKPTAKASDTASAALAASTIAAPDSFNGQFAA